MVARKWFEKLLVVLLEWGGGINILISASKLYLWMSGIPPHHVMSFYWLRRILCCGNGEINFHFRATLRCFFSVFFRVFPYLYNERLLLGCFTENVDRRVRWERLNRSTVFTLTMVWFAFSVHTLREFHTQKDWEHSLPRFIPILSLIIEFMHGRAGDTITVARNKDTECERASDKERTKKKQGITNVLNKLYGLLLWHKPHVCACEAYNANMRISEPSKTQRICIESATKCKASTDEKISNIIHDGRRWFYVGSFFSLCSTFVFHWQSIDRWSLSLNQYIQCVCSHCHKHSVACSCSRFNCSLQLYSGLLRLSPHFFARFANNIPFFSLVHGAHISDLLSEHRCRYYIRCIESLFKFLIHFMWTILIIVIVRNIVYFE